MIIACVQLLMLYLRKLYETTVNSFNNRYILIVTIVRVMWLWYNIEVVVLQTFALRFHISHCSLHE